MKSEEILERLRVSKSSVFSLNDVVKISGKEKRYVKVLVNRMLKRKILLRVEKNKYSLPNQNPFSIASLLIFPSYVSFISAYSYYNLTTQIPSIIFTVSIKQKKEVSYDGYRIKFITFSKEKFFGYKREYVDEKIAFVAEIEKAILDSLFLPRYCPISETFHVLREAKLDYEKLFDYVRRFNSKIAAKRLGYLLEVAGIDAYDSLKNLISKNYELLNPLKPPTNERDEKWKIIVNEVLE